MRLIYLHLLMASYAETGLEPGWTPTCHVAKSDFELLILLSPPPQRSPGMRQDWFL